MQKFAEYDKWLWATSEEKNAASMALSRLNNLAIQLNMDMIFGEEALLELSRSGAGQIFRFFKTTPSSCQCGFIEEIRKTNNLTTDPFYEIKVFNPLNNDSAINSIFTHARSLVVQRIRSEELRPTQYF